MIDVDELRRTLEEHALEAPDGSGVVEAAHAIHRRRRRRRTVAGAAAVAVLVAAVPVLVNRVGGSGSVAPAATKAPSPAPSYRKPFELTVDLRPGEAAAK